MDAEYWHQKWESNDTAFHEGRANALLVKHYNKLSLQQNSRILVPLCGKTVDVAWLRNNGLHVIGVELSEAAIQQLFVQLGISPKIEQGKALTRYQADNIDVFVGDFFDVTQAMVGPVDAVYDRAALVALPEEMRYRYSRHLINITAAAPQLLICFEYDQQAMPGPPFSIDSEQVNDYYSNLYDVTRIDSVDVAGGLKGKCVATENAWLLNIK